MKYILSVFLLTIAIIADAQQLRKEAFDLLNLDYPGLEKVKNCMLPAAMGGGCTGITGLLSQPYRHCTSGYRFKESRHIQRRTEVGG